MTLGLILVAGQANGMGHFRRLTTPSKMATASALTATAWISSNYLKQESAGEQEWEQKLIKRYKKRELAEAMRAQRIIKDVPFQERYCYAGRNYDYVQYSQDHISSEWHEYAKRQVAKHLKIHVEATQNYSSSKDSDANESLIINETLRQDYAESAKQAMQAKEGSKAKFYSCMRQLKEPNKAVFDGSYKECINQSLPWITNTGLSVHENGKSDSGYQMFRWFNWYARKKL